MLLGRAVTEAHRERLPARRKCETIGFAFSGVSGVAANTRAYWAERITTAWRQSVENIIETGREITAAKEDLSGDNFLVMVKNELPFGERAARMLMAVARPR